MSIDDKEIVSNEKFVKIAEKHGFEAIPYMKIDKIEEIDLNTVTSSYIPVNILLQGEKPYHEMFKDYVDQFDVSSEIDCVRRNNDLEPVDLEDMIKDFKDLKGTLDDMVDDLDGINVEARQKSYEQLYDTFYNYLRGYGDLPYEERPSSYVERSQTEVETLLSRKEYVESIDILDDEIDYVEMEALEEFDSVDLIDKEQLYDYITKRAENSLTEYSQSQNLYRLDDELEL